MVVSVILARGGSKGIPRKNIVDINGKPLLYYTIEASLKSGVDATWVSTDDEEIATIAYECGARVLKRPAKISTDKSTSESALMHFAEQVEFDHELLSTHSAALSKTRS